MENPICPYCQAEMIKASIQNEEGVWSHSYWICECEEPLDDDSENTVQLFIHHALSFDNIDELLVPLKKH
ncbi:hypothetical protein M0R19_05605 [Candidatus Pacearchaeota archaeon]|jgi:hypothetical protein|nr:hypothetical protein [Candidatus Pacearchaeota archaeon]